ncbi:unnamed protein product [Bursaphelenchus okinawaensis]|uniref:TPR_REGION domain-containing protein n=1 Tax=Bursaphelenchus okinawaensis TaxID=465554 RepID=A0A811K2W1_9BILA|nr:unnamed protein product [Bursaphelenchus okinawaensis]CAG9090546.1 unnamed protein product [Bursaphelenchus okinawaensis]
MDECRRLAQEGEEEIKRGNTQDGIKLLQQALEQGTQDPQLLSAIYSQLGNGYYAFRDFAAACKYHGNDLLLSHVQSDPLMEIKAMCNIAHSLAMNGNVDEAINNAREVILAAVDVVEMSMYECRGYYALGCSYFQKFLRNSAELGLNNADVVNTIHDAIEAYTKCLEKSVDENGRILPSCSVVRSLTLGNLGISYYYLGQFDRAKRYYEMRLETAKSVGDRAAQLRTYTNLGNTCAQIGEYQEAVVYYGRALTIANRDKKKDTAAQLYFNLGSTEALQGNYKEAFLYHLSHLELAKALRDVAGEARAYLNLSNCLENLDQLQKALYFLALYWNLAYKLNEQPLIEKAREAAEQMVHRYPHELVDSEGFVCVEDCSDLAALKEKMEGSQKPGNFFKLTNISESLETFIHDCQKRRRNSAPKRSQLYERTSAIRSTKSSPSNDKVDSDDIFDQIFNQPKQYEDQRCDIEIILKDRTNKTRQGDSINKSEEFVHPGKKSAMKKITKSLSKRFGASGTLRRTLSRPSMPFKKSNSLHHDLDLNSQAGSSIRFDEGCSRSSLIDFMNIGSTETGLNEHMEDKPIPNCDDKSQLNFDGKSSLNFDEKSNFDNRSVSFYGRKTGENDEFSENNEGRPSLDTKSNFTVESGSRRDGTIDSYGKSEMELIKKVVSIEERFSFLRKNPEDILDLIMNMQGRRMDEQRADPILPGLADRNEYLKSLQEQNDGAMSERLYEIIMERQSHRLDDQRSELGGRPKSCSDLPELPNDMSELVIAMSSRRMEDQRASLKPLRLSDSNLTSNDESAPVRCASASATVD